MDKSSVKHIASCSFGKDSLATVLLCLEHGEPLDEVIYCEVMFDQNISGEVPEHRDFIYKYAIPFLEENGIKVVILRSDITFIQSFYSICKRGKHAGQIRAWPLCGKCCIQRDCKLAPVKAYMKSLACNVVQYIGYAYDEQERLMRLERGKKVSLLEKYRLTEQNAVELCKKAGLYSPIYQFAPRNGCFFCANAKMRELRHLYDYHPNLWSRLLECQKASNKSTELFNRDSTITEIDELFQAEDRQLSLFDKVA